MPLYETRCRKCKAIRLITLKISDLIKYDEDPYIHSSDCPHPMVRVITAPSVIFKGGGFYSTDNRG